MRETADDRYVGSYQNFVPGLLDYVTYYPTNRSLTRPGNLWELYDTLIQLPSKFIDITLLGRFIENHDQPRFAGQCNDTGLRQSALVFNILSDAIPIVHFPLVEREADVGVLWARDVVIGGTGSEESGSPLGSWV